MKCVHHTNTAIVQEASTEACGDINDSFNVTTTTTTAAAVTHSS